MITTILFDFGDIFVNLEKEASKKAFEQLGLYNSNTELLEKNELFEKGKISENEFLTTFLKYLPTSTIEEVKAAWNVVIGEFPLYRLEFLQMLSQKYRLFLLTNTDEIHIAYFEESVGMSFYTDFYRCFEKVFYSYEMGMRKPQPEIYKAILNRYELSPRNVLFVDDKKENTDAAAEIGIHVWNLQVGKEDVVDLFSKKQLPL
jgi:putative hydrolase of the HAD superfamily